MIEKNYKISDQRDDIDRLIDRSISDKTELSRSDIRQIIDTVLLSFGIHDIGNNSTKEGVIDFHRKTLSVFCVSPNGGLELLPLRPGSKVEILLDGAWQNVAVVADENGRAALDLPDDAAPIGAPARIPLEIDETKINLLNGGQKNYE